MISIITPPLGKLPQKIEFKTGDIRTRFFLLTPLVVFVVLMFLFIILFIFNFLSFVKEIIDILSYRWCGLVRCRNMLMSVYMRKSTELQPYDLFKIFVRFCWVANPRLIWLSSRNIRGNLNLTSPMSTGRLCDYMPSSLCFLFLYGVCRLDSSTGA